MFLQGDGHPTKKKAVLFQRALKHAIGRSRVSLCFALQSLFPIDGSVRQPWEVGGSFLHFTEGL